MSTGTDKGMPYTIIGTVVAKPTTREELLGILADQVAPTRLEPGCINYDFHVDANDPCRFVFYENWRSKADLDAHLAMPHLQPLFSRLGELLAGRQLHLAVRRATGCRTPAASRYRSTGRCLIAQAGVPR